MKQDVSITGGRQTYYISETARVGKDCDIRHGVIIEDDVVVGDNCFIGEYAYLAEGTVVEDCVYIGARASILSTDRINHLRGKKDTINPSHIAYGARIAPAAVIFPGITIGENALVGIAAVVARDVPPRQIWFGFPAKKRGNIGEDECVGEKSTPQPAEKGKKK